METGNNKKSPCAFGEGKRFSMIYEMLPTGKDKAVTKTALCNQLSISERTLREIIKAERESGAVILSNAGTGGYYKPSSTEEIDEYIAMQRAQIISRFRSVKSARELKKQLEKQQSGQLELSLQEGKQ